MYRVFKPAGSEANVSVENTETLASVVIGRVNIGILEVLSKDYTSLRITDEWNLEIDKDTAKKLTAMTMTMNKPIRDQRKKPEEEKKVGVDIDAFDLIYGI